VKKLTIVLVVLLALGMSAGAGAVAMKRMTASPGDIIVVSRTKTLCTVIGNSTAKPFVTCYKRTTNGGPKVGSYGVAITDTGVVVAKYVTQRKTKTVYQHRH
jgi:hypothetical protein